ncbi:MAG: hypothetical protein EYC70_08685 [Planctomycetota bacterium]|nr:MAG: hypothetical protein EYC70_08685 [Planctomycetota bacterium]
MPATPADPSVSTGLGCAEKGLLCAVLAGWFGLFLLGMVVDSFPYRSSLAQTHGSQFAWTLIVILFTYTLTNIPVLCVLAGMLGALGRKATLLTDGAESKGEDRINPLPSAALRGFFVYLTLISSVLIIVEDPFSHLSAEQYVRLAGFSSLASFLVSYEPGRFAELLERAAGALRGRGASATGGGA